MKRAVIHIERVMDIEHTSANHLEKADITMQTMDHLKEAIMPIKQEPTKSLTDSSSNTLLSSRESSTSSFDSEDDNLSIKGSFFAGNQMALARKQKQSKVYDKDHHNANRARQEEPTSSEKISAVEAQEPVVKRKRQAISNHTKQAEDDNGSDLEDYEERKHITKRPQVEMEKTGTMLRQQKPKQTPVGDNDQGDIYQCPKCPFRTNTFLSLMAHRQTFHSGRGYEGSSIKHMQLNPILRDPNHYCRACERKFSTANTYMNHLQLVHHISITTAQQEAMDAPINSNPSKLTCRFCSQEFDSRLALTRHQVNDHNKRNNGKKARCNTCDIDYKSTRLYMQHRRLVHSAALKAKQETEEEEEEEGNASTTKTKKAVTCKVCGDGFATIREHLAHFNHVHRDYTKKTSPKADAAVTRKKTLPLLRARRKLKTKTVRFLLPTDPVSTKDDNDATLLQCGPCNMAFDTPPDMSRHMWSVHQRQDKPVQEKESPTNATTDQYRCRSCLVACESRSALTRHLSTVHNNFDYSSPKKKSVAVPQPDKKSRNNSNNKSSSIMKFECSMCSTVCEGRSALSLHLWAAHPVRMRKNNKKKSDTDKQPKEEKEEEEEEETPVVDDDDVNTTVQQPENGGDENDLSKYCTVCQKTYKNQHSYRSHMYNKHRDNTTAERTDHSPDDTLSKTSVSMAKPMLPDINDPNFYCRVCDKTMRNKSIFYGHILAFHADTVATDLSLSQQATATPPPPSTTTAPPPSPPSSPLPRTSRKITAMLDVDDPNHHCAFCDCTFKDQHTFHQHLRSKHYIKARLNNNTTTAITTATTTTNHSSHAFLPTHGKHLCTLCQQRQVTLGQHRQHLRLVHKVKLPPVNKDIIQFRYPDEFIDINSPDLYCAQCDHYFSTRAFFIKHVDGVHGLS